MGASLTLPWGYPLPGRSGMRPSMIGPDVGPTSVAGRILRTDVERHRSLKWVSIAGMAAAGVMLGHWLAYVLAVPGPKVRAAVLAESGHSYWLLAVKLAVVLGLSGAGALVVRQWIVRRDLSRAGAHPVTMLTAQLALLQVVAFTAMEVAERVGYHAPVAEMFQHHIFFLGVAVQFLVAFVGALILTWLGRAVCRLAATLAPQPLSRSVAPLIRSISQPVRPVAVLTGAAGVRGPPSP